MEKIKIRITIAYDGSNYAGWQVQKIGVGVQEKLNEAVKKIFPDASNVEGSSRTDAGVHALGMVAHFEVPAEKFRMPMRKVPLALNAYLPEDIRVMDAKRCPPDFHARFSAKGKQYRYFIWNHPANNPLLRNHVWHIPRKLNLKLMKEAARLFVGTHDFRSFAANRNYEYGNTVRTLWKCDIKKNGNLITFIIEGDGFLYKMCRGIVGTIAQVGLGKFTVDEIPKMFAQRDRRVAGMSAPAHGLVLWKVMYDLKAKKVGASVADQNKSDYTDSSVES
jgi:tRNA pseudouridine38-40 synthase